MKGNLPNRAVGIIISRNNEELAELTVEKIAHELGANPSYLSRIFNDKKNLSITEFFTGERLRRCAALLLMDKQLGSKKRRSIHQLTRIAGYSRSDYFVRLFKEKFGIHPENFLA
jgi:two-component system response regulator YesN